MGPGHHYPEARGVQERPEGRFFLHGCSFRLIRRASQVHNQPLARFLKVSETIILVIEGFMLLSSARHLIPGARASVSRPYGSSLYILFPGTASLGKAGLSLWSRLRETEEGAGSPLRRSAIIQT